MTWTFYTRDSQRLLGLLVIVLFCIHCSQSPREVNPLDVSQLIEQGDYKTATEKINKALIENPRDPNLLYNLALIQRLQGKLNEAVLTLNRAEQYAPNDDTILLLQTELALERNNEQEAWDHFVKVSSDGQQTARAQMLKGLIHAKMNDLAQAESALRAALELGNQSASTKATLAFVIAEQGRAEESKAYLAEAEAAPNPFIDVRLQIGETYLTLGEAQSAVSIAKDLQKQESEDARIYTLLGKAEMILLNFGEAESAFTRALSCPNATPWTRVNYALMLFAAQREDEAYARAKEAESQLELSENTINDPELYNLLATLYARRDQILMAHNYLTRSLQVSPNQPKVRELINKITQE